MPFQTAMSQPRALQSTTFYAMPRVWTRSGRSSICFLWPTDGWKRQWSGRSWPKDGIWSWTGEKSWKFKIVRTFFEGQWRRPWRLTSHAAKFKIGEGGGWRFFCKFYQPDKGVRVDFPKGYKKAFFWRTSCALPSLYPYPFGHSRTTHGFVGFWCGKFRIFKMF